MEVTRFDFALAQLRVNPAKVKSFPVSEHPSAARLRSILTNFISRVDLHHRRIIFRRWTRISHTFLPPFLPSFLPFFFARDKREVSWFDQRDI